MTDLTAKITETKKRNDKAELKEYKQNVDAEIRQDEMAMARLKIALDSKRKMSKLCDEQIAKIEADDKG
jgi:hypothetical protein